MRLASLRTTPIGQVPHEAVERGLLTSCGDLGIRRFRTREAHVLAQAASAPVGAEGEYAEESEGGPPRAPLGPHLATQVVVGETEARWTGDGDRFTLGNLLVDPAVSVVDLGGTPL